MSQTLELEPCIVAKREEKKRNDTNTRIDIDVLKEVVIAAGIKGMSVPQYISLKMLEAATKEIDDEMERRAREKRKAK